MQGSWQRQFALGALLLSWGAAAVIAQSVLVRETTVLFYAGEISWGIMFFTWLVGVSAGAWAGGRLAARTPRPDRWLVGFVGLFALSAPAGLLLLRCSRLWLEVGPGEYIPMVAMFGLCAALVSPFGLWIGLVFPLTCRIARGDDPAARIGWVYTMESAGSLIGGLAFAFLIAGWVPAFFLVGFLGAFLLACVSLFVWVGAAHRPAPSPFGEGDGADLRRPRRIAPSWISLGLAVVVGGIVVLGGTRLEYWSIRQRWRSFAPGMALRASADTRYQNIAVGWRDGQYQVYANGHPTATFPEPVALRWPAQVTLCQHPRPRRVLLIGGGISGWLPEVLTHETVEHVDLVELDRAALELVRPHLPPRTHRALEDRRVRVVYEDARRFVQRAEGPYDLVIGDFGPPASALVARFYTVEFYRQLARVLSDDGVFAFQTETSPAELRPESAKCTGMIYRTLRTVFGEVLVGWGAAPLVFAGMREGMLTTDEEVLGRRLAARGVPEAHFMPADFALSDQLDAARVAERGADLKAMSDGEIHSDAHPRLYLLWLERWEQQQRRRAARELEDIRPIGRDERGGVFAWLTDLRPAPLAIAVLGAWAFWLVARVLRRGRAEGAGAGAVLGSLASTGFAAMALEIALLYAYQTLVGFVYERIGAMMGVFMFGLVVGSAGMRRLLRHRAGHRFWLVLLDLGLAAVCLALPFLVRLLEGADRAELVTLVVCSLVAFIGALAGAAFPLGGRMHGRRTHKPEGTAGAIDAADHFGACLGALATGVVLVPAFGLGTTCILLACAKAMSATFVLGASWGEVKPDRRIPSRA